MKKILLPVITMLASLASTNASAQSDWSIGLFHANQEYSKRNNFETVGVRVGYQFTEHFSLEARLAKGTSGYSSYHPSISADLGEDINWQRGLFAKASYPLSENLNIYALAGYSSTRLDVSSYIMRYDQNNVLIEEGPYYYKKDNKGFSYGAGLNYQITERFSLFAEHQVLPDYDFEVTGKANKNWQSLNVGVNYHF